MIARIYIWLRPDHITHPLTPSCRCFPYTELICRHKSYVHTRCAWGQYVSVSYCLLVKYTHVINWELYCSQCRKLAMASPLTGKVGVVDVAAEA